MFFLIRIDFSGDDHLMAESMMALGFTLVVAYLAGKMIEKLGFPSEQIILSLEMRMKCGIGICGRCNIGHQYVCKDGPVFSLAQLKQLPDEY